MGLISVLLCRHHKRVMSNYFFLNVCTFVSLLVRLRNTKKVIYTHFLIDVCDNFLVGKPFLGFTLAASLTSYLDWLVLLQKMQDRFV